MMKSLTAIFAALLANFPATTDAEELTAAGPDGWLAGTLVRPAEGRPLVLIVPGSGPTDRDGNNPLGVTAAPYRLLAEALHARGIGTLRIDKRGMFGSKGAVADANAVTIVAYGDDVSAWSVAGREATGADCVWLLGHSEGGLVALAAAHRTGGLCGLILVASPGRPVGETLRDQLRANPANAPFLDQAFAAIDRLEAGERIDATPLHPALQGLFAPQVQGFLIDMLGYDPAALAAEVDLPLLIVHGGMDIQVGPAESEALRRARPAAAYVAIPRMNHVLKDVVSDDRTANLAAYADSSLPVSPALVDAIAAFVVKKHDRSACDEEIR